MLLIAMGITAMAQQRIQLRSTDRAECVEIVIRHRPVLIAFDA